jgi:hypothetical protein
VFRLRRSADSDATRAADDEAAGGKGRATPTRREAEAARKERAKPPQDRRAAARAQRAQRAPRGATSADRAKARAAAANGDERYMLARDRGPVRKFARDYVDSRLTVGQYMLPAVIGFLIVSILISRSSSSAIREYPIIAFYVFVLYVAIDTTMITIRLKRIAAAKFPDESMQGIGFYGAMRALQVRRLRQPKPRVSRGQPV